MSDLVQFVREGEIIQPWRPISSAPRDGTPILVTHAPGEYPVIVYWAHVGRYTSTPKFWLGHPGGAMSDHDIAGWLPLPEPMR